MELDGGSVLFGFFAVELGAPADERKDGKNCGRDDVFDHGRDELQREGQISAQPYGVWMARLLCRSHCEQPNGVCAKVDPDHPVLLAPGLIGGRIAQADAGRNRQGGGAGRAARIAQGQRARLAV